PAALKSISIDGHALSIDDTARATLPLNDGPNAVRALQVTWNAPPGLNPWQSAPWPALAHGGSDVRLGPVFWTLNVPAGYRVKREDATPQVGPTVYDLGRAAVLADLIASGDSAKKDSMTSARIDRLLRRAEYRLNSQIGTMPGEVGAGGQSL